ncbi:MAG: hypothetical protein HQL12_09735 [Candidatus Omnitrophica bacterium]|nr:hypothetical protein [Candidatus Omnitrophota bacterium]
MARKILRFRSALVFIFGLAFLCLGTLARADDHGNRYHYRDGQWYGHGEILVPNLKIGAVVETVPPQGRIVVVENTRYYYDNTRYYSQSPDGSYVVVEAPTTVVVERPATPLIQIRL